MEKGSKQRLKLLYMRDYLLENTDENNKVQNGDISKHLMTQHEIEVKRQTVYTDIELLRNERFRIGHIGNVSTRFKMIDSRYKSL